MMRAAVLILGMLVAAGCGKDPYQAFQQRLNAGASCQELFDIRNGLDPKAPIIEKINDDLSYIGCYSASSSRRASPDKSQSPELAFTVREYRIYRMVMDTPMSVSESQSLEAAAKHHNVTADEVKRIADKVSNVLATNKWFGSGGAEIRHASDWNGEER